MAKFTVKMLCCMMLNLSQAFNDAVKCHSAKGTLYYLAHLTVDLFFPLGV